MKKRILLLSLCMFLIKGGDVSALDTSDVKIHGFVSYGFLKSDYNNYLSVKSEDGDFAFNEAGINLTTQLNSDLRLGMQLFARDLGKYGNDHVILDWAFADYRLNNHLGFRIGKIKVAYGLYNEARDYDAVRTSILLPMSVYREADRELLSSLKGISIYGELPFGLSYQAGYGIYTAMETHAENKIKYYMGESIKEQTGSQDVFLADVEIDSDSSVFGAIRWQTPLEGLRLGLSYIRGSSDFSLVYDVMDVQLPVFIDFESVTSTVGSIEYMFGNTVITTEFSSTALKKSVLINGNKESDDQHFGGGYASISHRFTDWLELGTHYSVFYTDFDDKEGKDQNTYFYIDENSTKIYAPHLAWEKDLCVSSRFDLNDSWIIKLEGHKIDGTAFVDVISYTNKNISKDFYLFAAKVSFSF